MSVGHLFIRMQVFCEYSVLHLTDCVNSSCKLYFIYDSEYNSENMSCLNIKITLCMRKLSFVFF